MPTAGSLFGYGVTSDFELARLRPGPGPRSNLRIERATGPLTHVTGDLVAWSSGPEAGGWTYALFQTERGLIADCSVTGSYLIDAPGGRVVAEPRSPGFEHRLVSAIAPLFAAERGDVVLHASAVVTARGAVLFCGRSGVGKSTLAYLLAHAGHPMLAEDGAALTLDGDRVRAWPGPLGARVADDSAAVAEGLSPRGASPESKPVRFAPGQPDALPAQPVAAVVALAERGSLPTEPELLDPLRALPHVASHLVHSGRDGLRPAFAGAARLAERVPVYRCALPDDLSVAPAAAEELLRAVTSSSARPAADAGPSHSRRRTASSALRSA